VAAFNVDGLTFTFPDDWQVAKYDEWSYYRNQFGRMRNSICAVDLVARAPDRTVWLVEVKDYRHPNAAIPKLEELADVAWCKVYDTLAALVPAGQHASDPFERQLARQLCRGSALRVVLHVEQPAKRSVLFPRGGIDPANLRMKLKQLLKPIDPHALVASTGQMANLPWGVH
jgi:hypothetical protein